MSSVDSNVPMNDMDGLPLSSVSYIDGNNLSNVGSYLLNETTIYDNALRAIFKSSDIYQNNLLQVGFINGFYRAYPYQKLDSFETLSSTCYYNNQPKIGYDPRCRIWYDIAKNDDLIHYASPLPSAKNNQIEKVY